MSTEPSFSIEPAATPTTPERLAEILAAPGFGKFFTDHMVTMQWTAGRGWHDGRVRARAPFTIDPAAAVLHYAQEIFEGMKAYRGPDGTISLFRPRDNAARFNQSAARMAMPELPAATFVEAVEQLVRIDARWIPGGDGSLYLRPFMFASETFLGVRPSESYEFCVIACPVASYFGAGDKPISVWVSDEFSRVGARGTGAAKCGGNYAASLLAQQQAAAKGCNQVVFLDAAEGKWVEELGGMNIFFVFDGKRLATPPLGTILPGITRASLMSLAGDEGIEVSETPYTFEQWQRDAESGSLTEVFACGTAAVVSAIGTIRHRQGEFTVGGGTTGPVARLLRDRLSSIQRGQAADPHGWRHVVAAGA